MNIIKKSLFLALISLLSGGMLQAMDQFENQIVLIEFYDEKEIKNPHNKHPYFIGFLSFYINPTYSKTEAIIGQLRITKKYAGRNLMKLFMLYGVSYIFQTNTCIDTISFGVGTGEDGRPDHDKLKDIYRKVGAEIDNSGLCIFKKYTLEKSWFKKALALPLKNNSQVLKDIYVKIIDEITGKQINLEETPKNNSEENNQIQSKL